MAIPTHYEIMIPLLEFLSDGQTRHVRTAIEAMASYFAMNDAERQELLPSGKQARFDNRVHWAATYLKQAGLVAGAGRGKWQITGTGIQTLESGITKIDKDYLMNYASFEEFATPVQSSTESSAPQPLAPAMLVTPEELMEQSYEELNRRLASELLETIRSISPQYFEQLVVDLLLAMGYGSSLGYGQRIGRSGDGGIDGFIQEDKLGLETIYVQAKRWGANQTVGRPDIQGFVGSLASAGATKGVFITTSSYSGHAKDYVQKVNQYKIILIDGELLTKLMIEHNIGVSTQKSFIVKRIDSDYFQLD